MKTIEAISQFCDNVLEHGRDRWSGRGTPLLADGVNVDTRQPVTWRIGGKERVLSNFASQQNLMRTLTGLSGITGDDTYRQAAEAAVGYMFDNHQAECGLLRWGGHMFIDLATLEYQDINGGVHELKCSFPFYELMWQVNPASAARFVRAFWNAHILDWSRLDMNRHGRFNQPMGALWDNKFETSEPFFEGDGLTFINAGTDMIYAAANLYLREGEEGALQWAVKLAEQYVRARHPETNLGVYQYSKPRRTKTPPPSGPLTGNLTYSWYGDRAACQLGAVYGDVAREGWALWGSRAVTIYANNALIQLDLAEKLKDRGEDLLKWTVDGLKAYAQYGYRPETNDFRPLWADGTNLTGAKLPRSGYYGAQGSEIRPLAAGGKLLMAYARACRLSGDGSLWELVRQMADGNGLGDIGRRPGHEPGLNMDTAVADPAALLALLELNRIKAHPAYVKLAAILGENILDKHFHKGFFLRGQDHVNACFNEMEPLALLALEAEIQGCPAAVPAYSLSCGGLSGKNDIHGSANSGSMIWSVRQPG